MRELSAGDKIGFLQRNSVERIMCSCQKEKYKKVPVQSIGFAPGVFAKTTTNGN